MRHDTASQSRRAKWEVGGSREAAAGLILGFARHCLILCVVTSDQLLAKERGKALGAVNHVPQCCLDDDSRARRPWPQYT